MQPQQSKVCFWIFRNWPVWQRLQCPHWRSLRSRHRRLLRRAPSEYTSPARTSQKPVRAVGIKGDCKRGNTAWVQAAHRLHNAHCKKCPINLLICRFLRTEFLFFLQQLKNITKPDECDFIFFPGCIVFKHISSNKGPLFEIKQTTTKTIYLDSRWLCLEAVLSLKRGYARIWNILLLVLGHLRIFRLNMILNDTLSLTFLAVQSKNGWEVKKTKKHRTAVQKNDCWDFREFTQCKNNLGRILQSYTADALRHRLLHFFLTSVKSDTEVNKNY